MVAAYLVVGSTGAGKTTYAREIAKKYHAQVFSIDEWMQTLFWMDAPAGVSTDESAKWALERVARCEKQIWAVASKLLDDGQAVVLDLGFSKKAQREQFREWAKLRRHPTVTHFLDLPVEQRWARVQKRNAEKSGTYTFDVDRKTFDWMEDFFEALAGDELARAVVRG